MGKWIAIGLVASVFTTVAGMWFMFDRSRGKPDPRITGREVGTVVGHSATAPAATASLKATSNTTPAAAGTEPPAKMVQPESLEQGFIIVVNDPTKKASRESPIHMPSSHNGWNPADPKMKLEPQSDMKWRIEWSKPVLDSRIAFKFARGSWEQVETDAGFKDIDNRMLPMVDVSRLKPGEKPVIELSIVQWRDNAAGQTRVDPANRYRPIGVGAGTIKRLEVVGGLKDGLVRDALVWLPPGYDAPENASKSYPVLYLLDGQNVFEKLPSVPGEWEADETAAKLIESGKIEPLIIVGIPHAGAGRMSEYSPIELIDNAPARGSAFVDFVVNGVMPRLARSFRVIAGAEHTAIGGASLGGLIALEAGLTHPGVFGTVLAESTPLTMKDKAAFKHFASIKDWPNKISFGMGGHEVSDAADSANYVASAQAFAELAKGKGLGADRFRLVIDADAKHDELAWAKRLGPALEFAFPKR